MPEYHSYDSTVYDGGEASLAKLVISPVKVLKGHSNRAQEGAILGVMHIAGHKIGPGGNEFVSTPMHSPRGGRSCDVRRYFRPDAAGASLLSEIAAKWWR